MDHRSAERANALKRRREVADGEVGEGGRVAGARSPLVYPQAEAVISGLPSSPALHRSGHELGAQHSAPEEQGALGVVSRELDQRGRHEPEYAVMSAYSFRKRARG